MAFNFKLLNDSLEFNVDFISSHLESNVILIDHMFHSQSTIGKLQFHPPSKSKFSISLYYLLSIALVWPTLISDVMKLDQFFIHEYSHGNRMFYV